MSGSAIGASNRGMGEALGRAEALIRKAAVARVKKNCTVPRHTAHTTPPHVALLIIVYQWFALNCSSAVPWVHV